MIRSVLIAAILSFGCVTSPLGKDSASSIYVSVGETYLARAVLDGRKIVGLEGVSGDDFDSDTFTFSLEDKTGDDRKLYMLAIRNQLADPIKYDLHVYFPGSDDPVYASSCPLNPDVWMFESWGQDITAVKISNLRFLGSEERSCR